MREKLRLIKLGISQRGVGIVEVLVALVVVSFGVLGMASLQLTGMKHSTGGFNRSKALMFSENIATRMRINEKGVEDAQYGNFVSETAGLDCNTAPDPVCQVTPAHLDPPACSPEQLAEFDLFTVACGDVGASDNDGVLAALPGGQLVVDCDTRSGGICDPDSTHTITVSWQEGSVSSKDKAAVVNRRVQVRLKP